MLKSSPSWDETFKTLVAKRSAVVAIVGPKAVGKSTFARELFAQVQHHKESACYIETDLGRPEFIFPGVLSVHNTKKECMGAYFFGEDEPSQRPTEYLSAVERLCQFAVSEKFTFQVINTHGWFSMGQGQDILEGLLTKARVTDVVEIVPVDTSSLVRTSNFYRVWTLNPAVAGRIRESKAEYHRRLANAFLNSSKCDMFAVGLGRIRIQFPSVELPFEFALKALNTSIVGLLRDAGGDDPRAFLGVGLVCGIDSVSKSLLILTEVDFSKITQCTTVVMGTSNRLGMSHFPARFQLEQQDEETADVVDLEENGHSSSNSLLALDHPYVTNCKFVGFGSVAKRKGPVKRRRLE